MKKEKLPVLTFSKFPKRIIYKGVTYSQNYGGDKHIEVHVPREGKSPAVWIYQNVLTEVEIAEKRRNEPKPLDKSKCGLLSPDEVRSVEILLGTGRLKWTELPLELRYAFGKTVQPESERKLEELRQRGLANWDG